MTKAHDKPTKRSEAPPAEQAPAGEALRFDLEERTARFGEAIIAFARQIPADQVTSPLISQLVRAATSIGANYCEADEAESRKQFRYRIAVCKRESKETRFHLRMVAAAAPTFRAESRRHWQEARELSRIFAAILRKPDPHPPK